LSRQSTARKPTNSGLQLISDYRTVDYTVSNGNIVADKLSDRPQLIKYTFDNHINPEYFIDALSERSFMNSEIGSKNNLIRSTVTENGTERVVLTILIVYDEDGYPKREVLSIPRASDSNIRIRMNKVSLGRRLCRMVQLIFKSDLCNMVGSLYFFNRSAINRTSETH
jgi:hypothetical protein